MPNPRDTATQIPRLSGSRSDTSASQFLIQVRAPTGGNDPGGTRGTNYFFGFLVAFVVLLLGFAGCGLFSRRRLLLRQGRINSMGFEIATMSTLRRVDQIRPEFIEVALAEPPSHSVKWFNFMVRILSIASLVWVYLILCQATLCDLHLQRETTGVGIKSIIFGL